ncbi:hypothetical protein Dsin_016456 [Dipteronia sinensis]|uniref:Uncharacterized protein n=1 Tax=Dipteronia sinensis TaxID=43782 RepID=A0AAE0AEJ6_9ROSI|nr:hypothetical protein Dsin_016456 [Dipteronia sinensis]
MGSDDDDDDEEIARLEKERSTERRTSKNEDDGSESEEERLRDQREREQLEQHIRNVMWLRQESQLPAIIYLGRGWMLRRVSLSVRTTFVAADIWLLYPPKC